MTQDELHVNVCRVLLGTLAVVLAGFGCLLLDIPLARLFAEEVAPREIQAILDRAEVFGHAYGIAAIGLTIWFVSPRKRPWLPRFFFAAYGAGLVADLGKLLVWRYRPCSYDLAGDVTDSFAGSILTTSIGNLETMIQSAHHSFPSAHTASAFAAALVLGRVYPHARNWFLILALLVALNRVEGGAHFASDACWGAAIGCTLYAVALHGGWLRSSLRKMEDRISERSRNSLAVRGGTV